MLGIQQKWKYHLIVAILLIVMDYYGDYIASGLQYLKSFPLHSILIDTALYISFIVVYTINYKILCPRTLIDKKFIQFLLGILALIFLFAGIRYVLDEIIVFNIIGSHNYGESRRILSYYIIDNAYYVLIAITFSTSIYLFFLYAENKEKVFQLQLENKQAELNGLKSQISPHFLFNTLNTFYSELIKTQPKTAKDIYKLSELLRFVTYESQGNFILLSKDLKFIDDYVYFLKKRFENIFFLEYTIEGNPTSQQIPTMMLIHFVENVCKHGVTNDAETPAKINIKIENTFLEIKTINKVATSERYDDKGIGYENIKQRLDVLFQDRYELTYNEENTYFISYLKIPI